MTDQARERSDWEVRADLVCTQCSRIAGSVHGPAGRPLTPASIRAHDAGDAEAVQRLRCPCCSGRLWMQDGETIYLGPQTLSDEELHPRRGRPRKAPRAS